MANDRSLSIGEGDPHWCEVDASHPPYSAIGALGFWRGEDRLSHLGTAWLGAPRRIFTAGHVVRGARDRAAQLAAAGEDFKLVVKFGLNALGKCVCASGASLQSGRIHPNASDGNAFDVGFFDLAADADTDLMPYATNGDVQGATVEVPGYPAGKVGGVEFFGDTMFAAQSVANKSGGLVTYKADTYSFHSGAPVIASGLGAVAIHVGGIGGNNWGVLLNDTIVQFLLG